MPRDDDEIKFFIEASTDMTTFMVTIISPSSFSDGDLAASLRTLAEDIDDADGEFFKYALPMNTENQ